MIDQVRALLAHHLPNYQVQSVDRLGEGWDNIAYDVNGELIVRGSKEADPERRSELTRREADVLAAVARFSTLPVPEPVFVDVEAGVLAYRKLPGQPLSEHPIAEPGHLAATLGRFLSRLNRAPLDEMEQLVPRDVEPLMTWRDDAERGYQEIAGRLPVAARHLVEDFLGRRPPAEPRALAFCHNDLGSEHVLVDAGTNTITGVIDWGDAAIADPMYDPGMLYRDLGPQTFHLVLAHYDGPWDEADRERAVFFARCSVLEDIAYAVRISAPHDVKAGLALLARTFAQAPRQD